MTINGRVHPGEAARFTRAGRRGCWPDPVSDLGHVLAVLANVGVVFDQLVLQRLLQVGGFLAELRQAIDDVLREVEAVELVQHGHVEGGGDGAFFLVAAHVQVVVVRAPVGEAVNQPGIAVVREDNRLVAREQGVELRRTPSPRRPCGCSVAG